MSPNIHLILIFSLLAVTTTISATTTAIQFIQSKCSTTTYPSLCIQSLSSYANIIHQSPRQLAHIALIVSLSKAHYTKAYLAHLNNTTGSRPREVAALKDCMEEIRGTVDWLGKSIHEFQKAQPNNDFLWHISNVETWASAALTDVNTCLDGFEGPEMNGRIKSVIKAHFAGVLQCTSIALALVSQFANGYVYSP